MDRAQAKKMLPFIQAFAEGKEIQIKSPTNSNIWVTKDTCVFEGNPEYYRVKPESKLVPFTIEDAPSLIGQVIKWKDSSAFFLITKVCRNTIEHGGFESSFKRALDELVFLDGSPFGKIIEE